MSNHHAPWPVRKGIFRSTGHSDFIPTRSPSPIVEMPNTPQPGKVSSNPLSPKVSVVESPLSPTINLNVRDIPIQEEVVHFLFFLQT